VGVFPLARMHYMGKREASYTTLLMATGLTFGTISALFGFQNKIIDQRQYTILVSVVILSAFIPTLIAQKFFQPSVEAMHARVREGMRRVMEELDIAPPQPHSGAVWAAAINLMFCSISLNELTPDRMRAYGPLSADAAHRLDGIRADLNGLVAKLRGYLGKGA